MILAEFDEEKFAKSLFEQGKAEGIKEGIIKGKAEGKAEMMPVLGVAIAGAVALTAVTMKAIEYFKAKRKQSQAELEQAKQELIDGIKQYDAEHKTDTEVGLEVPDDKTETDRKKNDDE